MQIENKFQRVALVSSGQVHYTRPPAGVAFMAGVCEKNNIEYEIFDLNVLFKEEFGHDAWSRSYVLNNRTDLLGTPEDLLKMLDDFFTGICEKIQSMEAEVVAMTCLTFQQHLWAEMFLEKVKKLLPGVVTIIGGPGVDSPANTKWLNRDETDTSELFGTYLTNQGYVDYYVLGEGDIIFDKFLQGHRDGLPGLNRRGDVPTKQPQIDDLDVLPIPSYRKFNFNHYLGNLERPVVSITGSRGCVRRCTFCDIGHHWKNFRFRSGKNIAEEMFKHYSEKGITDFFFNDSLMNGSFKQFFDFMEHLHDLQNKNPGFRDIRYSGQLILRPKTSHSERMFELLSITGGELFQIGIESGSEAVRDHMKKKFSNDDIYWHFEMSEKYKISNWIFITTGYPTETLRDFQDTLDMYTNLQKYLLNDIIKGTSMVTTMGILANTPLNLMMSEMGIVYRHDESIPSLWYNHNNPELDEHEKYRRWVVLTKHVLSLGYPVSGDIKRDLLRNLNVYETTLIDNFDYKKPQKSVIPISLASINTSMQS